MAENMVEITLRLPPEALGQVLRAAAEALRGETGGPGAAEEENAAFQPAVFQQLMRRSREGDVPAAPQAPETPERQEMEAQEPSGRQAEAPGAAEAGRREQAREDREEVRRGETREPDLPPPPRREQSAPAEALPARQGTGTAAGLLSAPEPASHVVELPGTSVRRARLEPPEAETGEAAGLTAAALSERWERDSRRYDGGFTLY